MCGEFKKVTVSRTSQRIQTILDGAILYRCYSHRGEQAVPRLPFTYLQSSMNTQLQLTSDGTTSKSVNPNFILSDGNRLLLYVRPDDGKDCLHKSMKLREGPIFIIDWTPSGASSSLKWFDLSPFIFLMSMFSTHQCYF